MSGLGSVTRATALGTRVGTGIARAIDPRPRASTSMIDWVLTEKIAAYVAGAGDAADPEIDLATLVVDAERRVVAYTGLTPTRALPLPEGIDRREWVRANLSSMRRLLEPVLDRAGQSLGPLAPAVSLGVAVVTTIEIGVVLGYVAQRVLGQYELVLLDTPFEPSGAATETPPRLLFVLPNLGGAITSLDAPANEFLTWVALHEVTHAVQFSSVPWLAPHLAGLVSELLRSAQLRIDTPRRLRLPSLAEIGRVLRAVRAGDVVGMFANAGERETLDRVQAVMAVIEGHAEHVMDAVAPELLPSLPKLRAALDRRRHAQSGRSRLLTKLLGMEMKMRQYEQGKFFCDEIARRGGRQALVTVFSSPDALPTTAELAAPERWLERVGLPPRPDAAESAPAG